MIIVSASVVATIGWAQIAAPQPSSTELADTLADIYAKQTVQLLERFIPASEFHVRAKIEPSAVSLPTLPYVPTTLSSDLLRNLSVAKLREHAKTIELRILVTKRFNAPARQRLADLVKGQLLLDEANGDKVSFGELGIPVAAADSEMARQLATAEAELRNERQRSARIQTERDDMKQELSLAKSELDARPERSTSEQGASPEPSSWLSRYGSNLALAVAALFGLAILAFAFSKAGSGLGGAVTGIARALDSISGALATAKEEPATFSIESAPVDQKMLNSGPTSDMPRDLVYRRVLELNTELLDLITDHTKPIVLVHVSSKLGRTGGVQDAVAALEILGKDLANDLFQSLSGADQQAILRFLRDGTYLPNKAEALMTAGEQLKSRLFAGALAVSDGALNPNVTSRVMRLSDEDMLSIISTLHPDTLPRLFVYLEPPRIATLLDSLLKQDEASFATAVTRITQLPSAVRARDLDGELLPVLDRHLNKSMEGDQRPYLRFYLDIIEAADDDLADHLINGFAAGDASLEGHLRTNVMNYMTFFALLPDVQEEILATLPNRDIAAFTGGLPKGQQDLVSARTLERRRELVAEEIDRFRGAPERQQRAAFRQAKRNVVDAIRRLKGDGPLADLMAASQPVDESDGRGLPASNHKAA